MPDKKKVEVVLPTVKLRVDDLSYLQGIANRDGKTQCRIPDGNFHRLLLLGLIERVEVAPDPVAMKKFEDERNHRLTEIRNAVNAKKPDWGLIENLCGRYWGRAPMATPTHRITDSGRKLIANGSAHVEVKASCK